MYWLWGQRTLIFLSLHFLHPVRTFRCVLRAPNGLGALAGVEAEAVIVPSSLAVALVAVFLRLRWGTKRSRVLGLLVRPSREPEPGTGRYMSLSLMSAPFPKRNATSDSRSCPCGRSVIANAHGSGFKLLRCRRRSGNGPGRLCCGAGGVKLKIDRCGCIWYCARV